MNIAWWVQRWADLNPDKPAIIFEGEEITYSDEPVAGYSLWGSKRAIGSPRY
jgi:hypothetical protein